MKIPTHIHKLFDSSSEVSKEKSTKGCATLTDSCGIPLICLHLCNFSFWYSFFTSNTWIFHKTRFVTYLCDSLSEIIEIRWPWIETSKFVKQKQCRYQDFMCSSFTRFKSFQHLKSEIEGYELRSDPDWKVKNYQIRTDDKSIKIILYVQPWIRIR